MKTKKKKPDVSRLLALCCGEAVFEGIKQKSE
jgi:hypothetical protein